MAPLSAANDKVIVEESVEVRCAGSGLDACAVSQFFSGERAAFHEKGEHANAGGITYHPRKASEVGFCSHPLIMTELFLRDKPDRVRHNQVLSVWVRSWGRKEIFVKDLAIELRNQPGELAAMGEALGRAEVSVEGGGAFAVNGKGMGHFLFADGAAARQALEASGFRVLAENDVVLQRLNQAEPGQLGKLARRMAEADVNIEVQYSDHDRRLVLVVDDATKAQAVADAWTSEFATVHSTKHEFQVHTAWTGNDGVGTRTYRSYRRDHLITADGKTPIEGSSAPAYRGNAARYNPEELLVASLSACHMLWYLHLCSAAQIVVVGYEDSATGTLREAKNGSGEFVSACLHPIVTIAGGDPVSARDLHIEAHRHCFIANSVKFPIIIEPEIRLQTAAGSDHLRE